MATSGRIAIVGGGLAGVAAAQALQDLRHQGRGFRGRAGSGRDRRRGQCQPASHQGAASDRRSATRSPLSAPHRPESTRATCRPASSSNSTIGSRRAARYGAPYYTFHRADLLDALASGLDRSAIHLGHRLTGHRGAKRRRRAQLSTMAREVEAEFVIGADGVRSVIRHALYGDDNPTYTGQMVWRALLKGSDVPDEVLEPTGHIQWVGPGCHLLAYYIRGRKLVNIVTQEDTDKWVEEGWSTRGDPDEMRLSFPNPEPRLKKLSEPGDRVLEMGPVHAAADAELGPRPHPAHRRRRARHAAQCRARRLPGFRGLLHPGALARSLPRSGRGLCQFPPRPHSARAWGAAALVLQRALQAHARQRGAEGVRSTPAQAASTATPSGSGATIPSANGTKSHPFLPPMQPEQPITPPRFLSSPRFLTGAVAAVPDRRSVAPATRAVPWRRSWQSYP